MKTLPQLIQKLNTEILDKGIDNALDLLSPFSKYIGQDWQQHCELKKDEFQYSLLHKNEHIKLILIYWNRFRKSKKHGHLKGGGLMKVLAGEVIETRFHPDDNEKVIGTFNYCKGDLSYIHDALAYHVVENKRQQAAVSLHLYCYGENSTFGA